MADYEREFQRCANACGEPFPEFNKFFAAAGSGLTVLDLGCGQGRDALMAARGGHAVHGVDLAPTGIAQLLAGARAEKLAVEAEVADIEAFAPDRQYDMVVLDRVLHMLASDARRLALLAKVRRWVEPGGHVLVADTRRHRALIRGSFPTGVWEPVLARGDLFFARLAAVAPEA